ncbi:MAG: peptidase S8 [Halobacteriovorax sp.]|nr:peptidase S8 [Halobacteriovorax sp.]|tara:strand:+ start:51414 stop:52943 length:1530 start_codon:yes stop_codon:yes gene_type:complete
MKKISYYLWLGLFIWAIAIVSEAHGKMKSRLIVKRKNPARGIMREAFRVTSKEVHQFNSEKELKEAKENFKLDAGVEWVVEDKVMSHFFEPGDDGTEEDQLWFLQWHYHDQVAGINLPAAWDITFGEEVVVAVVDTGITSHVDLNSKILAGADLVSDPFMGNDGDGRDNDPSDPGDWISSGDPCFNGQTIDSSWHGTHVAGTIAAKTGNAFGVAGVSFGAKVVPVRVLGKCGGWASDIADGIKWAAGVPVSGVAPNANPARVINLSLGGRGSCSAMMQEAVDAANAAGAVVVVASGNSNQNIDFIHYSPANCKGVITVASTDENMDKSFFSNYGEFIDISAPGGGEVGVMSTHNDGTRGPGNSDYIQMKGTSMAAPHVAGVAALMVGVNPALSPAQIRQAIVDSAASFSASSSCDDSICGSGLLDAEAAVMMAQSMEADPDFVFDEPALSATSEPVTITWFNGQDEETGGACGTVDLQNGGGGGPFNLSLLLGLLMALLIPNIRVNKAW